MLTLLFVVLVAVHYLQENESKRNRIVQAHYVKTTVELINLDKQSAYDLRIRNLPLLISTLRNVIASVLAFCRRFYVLRSSGSKMDSSSSENIKVYVRVKGPQRLTKDR